MNEQELRTWLNQQNQQLLEEIENIIPVRFTLWDKNYHACQVHKAEEVDDLKEFGSEIVAPIEEELMEVRKIFSFLPSLKRYVDWVNADSLNNLSSTYFKVLIDRIRETR